MKPGNKGTDKLFFIISILFLLFAIYDYLIQCIGCGKTDLRYFIITLFIALVIYIGFESIIWTQKS
ncbi:hypothetical protein A4244_18595 [Bacillus badius]|nr:hypothetical protein A4244_18595 [Bacillus badius]OCS85117.1 hypothetical protein A6M11_18610 [Bacillus badius]OVE46763.1 hypothetical protein B1A98_19250 [Bacillus badius]